MFSGPLSGNSGFLGCFKIFQQFLGAAQGARLATFSSGSSTLSEQKPGSSQGTEALSRGQNFPSFYSVLRLPRPFQGFDGLPHSVRVLRFRRPFTASRVSKLSPSFPRSSEGFSQGRKFSMLFPGSSMSSHISFSTSVFKPEQPTRAEPRRCKGYSASKLKQAKGLRPEQTEMKPPKSQNEKNETRKKQKQRNERK